MLRKNKNGVYTLTRLTPFKNLVCAFSTRDFGNMKPSSKGQVTEIEKNRRNFLKTLGLKNPNVVTAQQIHSNQVVLVGKNDSGKNVTGADGLITGEKGLFLMVFVADCLPILAYDSRKEIVGIAHAGWQGTSEKIAENLVWAFQKLGSKPNDILVGIGPGIEFCHYEVRNEVVDKFTTAGFGKMVLRSLSGKTHIDLKQAVVDQLVGAGVPKASIDVSLKMCTYENPDFYSYRREKEKLSGEIAAVIGLLAGRQGSKDEK